MHDWCACLFTTGWPDNDHTSKRGRRSSGQGQLERTRRNPAEEAARLYAEIQRAAIEYERQVAAAKLAKERAKAIGK